MTIKVTITYEDVYPDRVWEEYPVMLSNLPMGNTRWCGHWQQANPGYDEDEQRAAWIDAVVARLKSQ